MLQAATAASAATPMTGPCQSEVIIVNDYKYRVKRDGAGSILVMRWLRDGSESSAECILDETEIPPRIIEAVKSL